MTGDNKDKVKAIIKQSLNELIEKISSDFKENYKRKVNNWTLGDFDSILVAHMVFVSSFESKSGNMFQRIAKEIAKIKYGEENVPLLIGGVGIDDSEFEKLKKAYKGDNQIIKTKIDQSACRRFITNFRETHKAAGRGKSRLQPTITQEAIKEINKENFKRADNITEKPVDLAIFNPKDSHYYIMEIKAGGDLDSSNAPANVDKMLIEYALIGKNNVKLYFATLYNKNGEGNKWTGYIKKYLSEETMLIGKKFWEVVLPEDISFEELKEIYNEVSKELKVSEIINKMISEVNS